MTLRHTQTILALTTAAALTVSACGEMDMMNQSGAYYNEPYQGAPMPTEETPSNEGDRYEAVGTHPFVLTAHDPQSTFATDVDTASYDIFRRDIENGILPQANSVRLEEFVNYFPYDYAPPAPDALDPFAIHVAAAAHPLDAERVLMRVGIKGAARMEEEAKPANLVFLIDVSGSMASGTKLDLVKTTLSETLEVLAPTDRVSIVTYAGNTAVRLESTPVSEKSRILGVLDSLSAGGSTAGASGIDLAYEQARWNYIENGINHVILCTDGDFNVGPSSNSALLELIREKRRTGITFTVLGYGTGNLNDSMMEAISNAGNGIYGVISSTEHAIDYVHERMLSSLQLIARDVKIQVELNPERVFAYRLLGYENRAIADNDFRNDSVDAGEIGAEHTVTALYELVLVGSALPEAEGAPTVDDGPGYDFPLEVAADELARVKLRYKGANATEEDSAIEMSAGILPEAIASHIEATHADFQWAFAIAAFAEILKESPYARPDALDTLEGLLNGAAGQDADRLELIELFRRARPLL